LICNNSVEGGGHRCKDHQKNCTPFVDVVSKNDNSTFVDPVDFEPTEFEQDELMHDSTSEVGNDDVVKESSEELRDIDMENIPPTFEEDEVAPEDDSSWKVFMVTDAEMISILKEIDVTNISTKQLEYLEAEIRNCFL
jgi:hypothetical protein